MGKSVEAARIEAEVLAWTNDFRRRPADKSSLLMRIAIAYKKKYKTLGLELGGINLIKQEGLAPLKDLVGDIKGGKIKTTKPLIRHTRLDATAELQLQRLLKNPDIGHDRPGGSMEKDYQNCGLSFGGNCWAMGENLSFGYHHAGSIVCGLIIDDGVSSRGHRYNIFSENFNSIGIAYATGGAKYNQVCVMNFGKII